MCAALARGLTLDEIVAGRLRSAQVPGRFQVVPSGDTGITVVVDYAHTDDALRNLIALGRELVKDRRWAGDYVVWLWWGPGSDKAAEDGAGCGRGERFGGVDERQSAQRRADGDY